MQDILHEDEKNFKCDENVQRTWMAKVSNSMEKTGLFSRIKSDSMRLSGLETEKIGNIETWGTSYPHRSYSYFRRK